MSGPEILNALSLAGAFAAIVSMLADVLQILLRSVPPVQEVEDWSRAMEAMREAIDELVDRHRWHLEYLHG